MSPTARFIPAIDLARQLARELEPRMRKLLPDVPMSLALIGPGSDVLEFDTARSMDHDWGPRLTIVVPEVDRDRVQLVRDLHLDELLPATVSEFPTRFSFHPDGTMKADPAGSLHRVEISSTTELLRRHLLIESFDELTDAVWLSTPMQVLLEITAGEVFVDDTGELTALRDRLNFYPEHIWRYQLAGFWMRISQVQPFIGRCFETGDTVGAATIALGIVRDLMRLALLQSRQYAPYAKWLGSALARTGIGEAIKSDLSLAVRSTTDYPSTERAINSSGRRIIEQLNELHLIPEILPRECQFHSRPYMVLPAEEIALALKESIREEFASQFEASLGGIDVITDSTDALNSYEFRLAMRAMFSSC